MNGADLLCETLLAHDVDVCFANPGTSEMHFVAALDRKPAMRCILGLFEGVATGAADGYARMRGAPAATLLHTGPGLANGLANLHNARRGRTPIVNIVGDHASYHLPFDALLTTDIEALARPMSNWVGRVAGPENVEVTAARAIGAAVRGAGPATLILPADAAWGAVQTRTVPKADALRPASAAPEAIRAAAEALRAAPGRSGLLLGGTATRADALAAAGRIAESCDAKLFGEVFVGRVEAGRGRVPLARIPYPVDAAVEALNGIDVLVLVGAPEPVAFFAYPGKPSRLVRDDTRLLTLASAGEDLEGALEALVDELGAARVSAPASLVARLPEAEPLPTGRLTDAVITAVIARFLPENAIVVEEALTSARDLFSVLREAVPHDYLMLTGGAIGGGLPMACGAAVACPDRKVIALQADGSGMYTVQALWTQARENLDVITLIYANRAYAILQREMRNVGVENFGRSADRMLRIDEPALDWVSLARGMGVDAARADTGEGLAALFEMACSRSGPFLIEAVF